jgi:uncharacterized cupredoxin-like copper-binding protein
VSVTIQTPTLRRGRLRGVVTALTLAAACALTTFGLSGCGSTRASAASEHAVAVTERDFHITAPTTLNSGTVTLRVHNAGPDEHELIIVPGTLASLPLRADGMTVDEEAVEASEPASLEPGQPGSTRDLTVQLKPGRYVFFCNMEGHFMAGMHTEVVVR